MPAKKKLFWTCGLLYVFSQILFLININSPHGFSFDEFHYVPSAKQYLELRENQNWEHPPLGKLIMAAGIGIFGDRPLGWRIMSTIFGALTLVGMYLWALSIFLPNSEKRRPQKSPPPAPEASILCRTDAATAALWATLLSLFNHLLYVQARIGMLDTFMFAFLVWSLAAFCASWNPELSAREAKRYLSVSGALLGFAIACKWFAVMALAGCIGLVVVVRVFQSWGMHFSEDSPNDFYSPSLWKGISIAHLAKSLILYPFITYFITFIPLLIIHAKVGNNPGGIFEFFAMQKKMYEGQLRVVNSHPYMSTWLQWPLLSRPIWYAFEKEPADPLGVRGVLLLGNPLIMWSGLGALALCIWHWLRYRSRPAFLIVFFYAVFFLSWGIIPRKVAFYYYYYPAGMTLSLALAYVFYAKLPQWRNWATATPWARWAFLGLAFGLFVYFFPILAGLRIEGDRFREWMWFRSWI